MPRRKKEPMEEVAYVRLQKQKIQQKISVFLPKPITTKKKTLKEIQRIQRSKNQKIYLLTAEKGQQYWRFEVVGATGTNYHVVVSTLVSCTCMDYKQRPKTCKHIYFIVTQVAGEQQLLQLFQKNSKLTKKGFNVLSLKLQQRLRNRLNKSCNPKDKADINLKDDTSCPICFSQMNKESEDLDDCGSCHKFYHVQCINIWRAKNPTCPMCRSSFLVKVFDENDPLGKVVGIKI